jgi:hypothetical protein
MVSHFIRINGVVKGRPKEAIGQIRLSRQAAQGKIVGRVLNLDILPAIGACDNVR